MTLSGLLSPVGPGPLLYLLFLLVVVPAAGAVKGSLAAAVTLPYAYRAGGWLFGRAGDAAAPLKHFGAGAALGVLNGYLVLGLVGAFLLLGRPGASLSLPGMAVAAQVAVAGLLGSGVLAVRQARATDRPTRGWTARLADASATHLGLFVIALVGVDVVLLVVGATVGGS